MGRIAALRTRKVRSASETRCEYVPVSSGPASLRGTVSETDLTSRLLDRGSRVLCRVVLESCRLGPMLIHRVP